MKTLLAATLLSPLLLAPPNPPVAVAADCAAIAQREAAKRGAQVLKASADGQGCVIRLRIPGPKGERPRVEEIHVGG